MWYYESNQQPFGPVSKETIADELKAGRITPQTRVWREGWAEWRLLGETELAVLAGLTPPSMNAAATAPVYMALPQYKKVDPVALTKLFWWWFGLTLAIIPFIIISALAATQTWVIGLMCAFEIPLVAGGVLQYILVYKFWQLIQDGFARTNPGKAVGFLFIPFFNFYWMFVAFFGLAKDQKAYIERHFNAAQMESVRKPHPAITLSYLIFGWSYILFYIVLMIIIFGTMLTSFSNPGNMTNILQPYRLVVSILSFIQMVLMFGMFFDFFLTSKSILKAEESKIQ